MSDFLILRACKGSRSVALSQPEPNQPLRTPNEIADAICALSTAQWVRLRKLARVYSLGRPMEAEDLLQEVFRRALDGERKCPVAVDIVRFLAEAMRSIGNSEYKKATRRPAIVPLPASGATVPPAEDQIDVTPNAEDLLLEEELEADRKRRLVIDLFHDDPIAQVLVEGMMEGMRGEDLRALTDLDVTAYESKRRLIRRRITKQN